MVAQVALNKRNERGYRTKQIIDAGPVATHYLTWVVHIVIKDWQNYLKPLKAGSNDLKKTYHFIWEDYCFNLLAIMTVGGTRNTAKAGRCLARLNHKRELYFGGNHKDQFTWHMDEKALKYYY